MPKQYIINALDIGSGSIKLLCVSKKPGERDFEILTQIQEPSLGIRKGVIVDVLSAAKTISSLIEKAEQNCGVKIERIYANIGGGHIYSVFSKGLVSVSRADRKISEEDVERVLQAAKTLPLPSNKEILQIFPKEYIVDGGGGVREAVGMEGVRLEAETILLCGFSPYIKNSMQTILKSGVQVNDLIADPLASARAVLTPREKELGVCVLDIGAGTISMAVFEEGNLIHASIFPIGSGHITSDIAICLKTDIDTAEKIKLEFGTCKTSCLKKEKKAEKNIKINGEEEIVFSKKDLTDIIGARVSEVFDLVNKELKGISRQGRLPAGVVLTGGGAMLPGIKELAKKELKLSCRIGIAQGFSGFQTDPSLSTLYGLILEGVDLEGQVSSPKGIKSALKKMFRVFIP